MSLVIWYTVMGLGMAGMIWATKKKKKTVNDKVYALGFCIVIVFSSIMVLVSFFSDPEQERAISNSSRFELSKLNQIAEFVNKKYAGKDVVILVRQDMLPTENNSDFVRIDPVKELKRMLNRDVNVKGVVVISPPSEEELRAMGEDPEMMPSFELSASPELYNKKFKECRALAPAAIIDLAGLPMGEGSVPLVIWKWGKKDPKIILPEVGDIGISFDPVDLVDGILDAVIVPRNDRKFNFMDDAAPKDLKEAFDTLYVFVTKDNIKKLYEDKVITIMMPMD